MVNQRFTPLPLLTIVGVFQAGTLVPEDDLRVPRSAWAGLQLTLAEPDQASVMRLG